MASDPIAVAYAEKMDSVSGGVDEKGEWESRVYQVAWSDRSAFMKQMAGSTRVSGGVGGKWVTTTPYQNPGNSRLYAASMSWEPAGTPLVGSDPGEYSHVYITVVYRPNQFVGSEFDPLQAISPSEPLLKYVSTTDVDYGRDWFSLPGSSVKFKSDGRYIKSSHGRHLTHIAFTLTYERFPFLPFGYFRDYLDTINDATWCGCERGSVMFDGAQVSNQRDNLVGQTGQKLVMKYKWRSQEWNKFLRDDTPDFDTVVSKSWTSGSTDGFTTYAYRDFMKLLWEDFV